VKIVFAGYFHIQTFYAKLLYFTYVNANPNVTKYIRIHVIPSITRYQVQKNNEKHIAKNKRYIFTDLAKD